LEDIVFVGRTGVFFPPVCRGLEIAEVSLNRVERLAEVTHNRAHSVAVDVDDSDRGKAGERALRVSCLR
jgi:hypothetical protein